MNAQDGTSRIPLSDIQTLPRRALLTLASRLLFADFSIQSLFNVFKGKGFFFVGLGEKSGEGLVGNDDGKQ